MLIPSRCSHGANLSGGKYTLAEYASALLLCKRGKAPEAERTVLYALESNDHRPLGHVILGAVMLYMNRLDEAERDAREALSLDARTQDAYLVLAAVHGEKND